MKKNLILVFLALISTAFCFAANPESDFDYVFLNNYEKGWLAQVEPSVDKAKDYLKITKYIGKSKIVDIPKEIEGYPVIATVFFGSDFNKVIVPESIIYLGNPYYNMVEHPNAVIELSGSRNTVLIMDGECFQYFKKLPMETKILTFGDIYFGNVSSITWSKNWKTNPHPYDMGMGIDTLPSYWQFYKRKKITGLLSLATSELTNTSGFTRPQISEHSGEAIKEFIFEEGCEEITGGFLGRCSHLEKLVIPKSMKFIFGGKANWNTLYSDYLYGKLDIEIAPGCQVEFDNRGFYFPENKLTIKSRKRLQEVGYKFQ